MLRAAFLALAVVSLAACGGEHCPDASATPGHITFAKGPALTVRIADDAHERADGLMNVTTLPANEGMAFLFGSPTDATFWMKDTPLPLSVAFVSDGDALVSTNRTGTVALWNTATGESIGPRFQYHSDAVWRAGVSAVLSVRDRRTACSAGPSASPTGSTKTTTAGWPSAWSAAPPWSCGAPTACPSPNARPSY